MEIENNCLKALTSEVDILYQYLIFWVGEEKESYHVEVLWKVFRGEMLLLIRSFLGGLQ